MLRALSSVLLTGALCVMIAAPIWAQTQNPVAQAQGESTDANVPADDPPETGGSPVPEPTTLLLVGTGLLGLAISSRRWRRLTTN